VLNIAQAIQVICYELYQAHQAGAATLDTAQGEYPTQAQLEHFYARLEHSLEHRGFLANHSHQQTLQRLIGVFKRARPSLKELNTWQGALSTLVESDQNDSF
jgi:tRNA (cytidine32/uridine32-2'-O)-methyltransferase